MAKEPKAAAKAAKAPEAAVKAPKAPKTAAKKEPKTAVKRTDGAHKPVQPSAELAEVVGKDPISRTEVVKKVWDYIKANKLQNPKDGREILADANLEKVFGTNKVTMFEMNKHLNRHLS